MKQTEELIQHSCITSFGPGENDPETLEGAGDDGDQDDSEGRL